LSIVKNFALMDIMEENNHQPFIINFDDDENQNLNNELSEQGERNFPIRQSTNPEQISQPTESIIPPIEEKTTYEKTESPFESSQPIDSDLGPIKEAVYLIEVEKIKPNPHQPRRDFDPVALQELADSIREYGILQPLIVTKIVKDIDSGTAVQYELIAGERRLRASQLLNLERVPAIVRPTLEERQKLEAAIIENVQRSGLNIIETARAYAKLADEFGLAQREIAQRIGISREAVSNAIRLLQLPSEAQRALQEGKISESHCRVILSIQNPEKQRALLGEILFKHLTVREAEGLARKVLGVLPIGDPHKLSLEDLGNAVANEIKSRLEETLGTKVEIKQKGGKGKITINFFSEEELNEILGKICKE
jgi:ParB family transcriptional regulator, chromosome partitioning protein